MTLTHRHGRTLATVLVCLGAACWSRPAPAQAVAPRASHAATAAVPTACQADLVRLCPEIDAPARQARSAAICLKPFKTSLSLPCRKAVRAVFP